MKYISRDTSVITGRKTLEPLYTFKDFPVFIGATDEPFDKDIFADLSLAICKETGIIQLDKVLPLDIVYSGYHSEALGGIWKEHHEQFIEFIKKYNLKNILEIGGSDGRLAKDYIKDDKTIRWTIVEPNPTEIHHDQIKMIPIAFDDKFTFEEKIDGIVHSHTLEHMYEPKEFLESISKLLKVGEYQLFSVPNLYSYFKNKFTNLLNFEHTIFLTEYFIDYLLNENNFEILEKKYFYQHSIFYSTKKIKEKKEFDFKSQYDKYKKDYMRYIHYNNHVIHNLNNQIEKFDGEVYLFGAHVFSQFLLNQGLNTKKIKGILDNSKIKSGKRLYGTPFIIQTPESLHDKKIAVILKAGAYQEEIKAQLRKINPSITIWE